MKTEAWVVIGFLILGLIAGIAKVRKSVREEASRDEDGGVHGKRWRRFN